MLYGIDGGIDGVYWWWVLMVVLMVGIDGGY